MSLQSRIVLSGLAIFFFSIPATARPDKPKPDITHWNATEETKIGSMDLKPGSYEFKSEESNNQLQVMQGDKTIGEVPCHWIELPKKAQFTEVQTNKNQVVQLEFAGRAEAVEIR